MNNADIKILIVDDEPDILDFLGYNLRKEGFQVFLAANGRLGLESALKNKPHLIILDIMMPEMDGISTCRELRSHPEMKDVIIAYLTARDEDFTQIAALDAGGDDYISKPVRPNVLISRIKALLRRLERTNIDVNDEIIEIGNLIINKPKVSVSVDGTLVDLPRKEFEILCLLVSRPGKVFTRDEIFYKIWGSEVIVGNRTIDVHIRKLREKVGEDFVKTVKGIGYKFDF